MCLCKNPPINKILHFECHEEKALANTLLKLNVSLNHPAKDLITIECTDKSYDYEILDEFAFDSVSSNKIIVKCLTTKKIFLFVKGNYELIKPLISDENDIAFLVETAESDISLLLKTILFVYKELNNQEALNFLNDLRVIKRSRVNVDEKIKDLYKNIEKDLIYLGIAGLEYVISEENIKTIRTLNNAGIKT